MTALELISAIVAVICAGLLSVAVVLRRRLADARAEAEQLRELVRSRLERPHVFSHEVRTPLTLIQGAAELLADEAPGPLNERQREFVTTIGSNAGRVIGLAEDMLTEARLDSPLFNMHVERIDLRQLVRTTVRDARRVHRVPIRMNNTGAPLVLHGDRQLIGQALWNLVNNSCRHAGADATITVSATRGEGEGILAVSDDGGGMTADERRELFTPFVRSAESGGSGLGMMITERIIEQHRGRLLVDSIPGRGTTVFVTLPLDALHPWRESVAAVDAPELSRTLP
ncbi:sensor histidine kinase [Micropruina sp.]|uniref:sensor histidine kinase n=1 Tax=Micropruina sp. TaxID=2737536 RepID=UPI0039E3A4A4